MSFNRYLILFLLILFSCTNQSKRNYFKVDANINNIEDSTKVFLYDTSNNVWVDSTYVIDNRFKFTGKISEPNRVLVYFDGKKQYTGLDFWIDTKTDILISFDMNTVEKTRSIVLNANQLKGSALNAVFSNLEIAVQELYKAEDAELKSVAKKKRKEIFLKYKAKRSALYFKNSFENPNNFVSLSTIFNYRFTISKDSLKRYYSLLDSSIKETNTAQKLKNLIDAKDLDVGDVVKDFIAKDLEGNTHRLSDYSKGVVLLNFWSSTCAPCRKENIKELPQINEKYKSKEFKMISFSLDTAEKLWRKASEKDSIDWLNISDLKGFKSKTAIDYTIKVQPTFFLIKNGVILKRIEASVDKVDLELQKIVSH